MFRKPIFRDEASTVIRYSNANLYCHCWLGWQGLAHIIAGMYIAKYLRTA